MVATWSLPSPLLGTLISALVPVWFQGLVADTVWIVSGYTATDNSCPFTKNGSVAKSGGYLIEAGLHSSQSG